MFRRSFSVLAMMMAMMLAGITPVFADDQRPPEIKPYIHIQTPYGAGKVSFVFNDLYQSTLWTDATSWSWQSPFALSLSYSIHVTREKLVEKSIEEIDAQSSLSPEEQESYTNTLLHIFPNISPDDRITALYTPRRPLHFFYNGKPIGTIKDAVFARRFMGIWLSEKTSDPDLRNQLLFVNNIHGKKS